MSRQTYIGRMKKIAKHVPLIAFMTLTAPAVWAENSTVAPPPNPMPDIESPFPPEMQEQHKLLAEELQKALKEMPPPEMMEKHFQEGFELLLKQLPSPEVMKEQMEKMTQMMNELGPMMGPLISGFLTQIDDLDAYHEPEELPNGDILIRRKTPLDPGHQHPERPENTPGFPDTITPDTSPEIEL